MASTINGYEGTGRSLSIKLIQQLRESTRASTSVAKPLEDTKTEGDLKKPEGNSKATVGRTLREIKLDEPIRYSTGDPVEKWLNTLLCLDASLVSRNISGCPHPSQCQLYHVSRDTLFSFHPASELFLQRMMALYVSSHYKNSPNDLQLMSDAPAHELFVLLPPIDADDNTLPEPLVVLQVAMEGRISKDVILESLARGERAGGDLIPWLMAQQVRSSFLSANLYMRWLLTPIVLALSPVPRRRLCHAQWCSSSPNRNPPRLRQRTSAFHSRSCFASALLTDYVFFFH